MKAQCDAMAARLRELGMPVDPNQVNIANLRLMAQFLGLAHLLVDKGIATNEEIDLATITALHNLLGGLLVQVEAQHDAVAREAKKPRVLAPPRHGLYVPQSARMTRNRHD